MVVSRLLGKDLAVVIAATSTISSWLSLCSRLRLFDAACSTSLDTHIYYVVGLSKKFAPIIPSSLALVLVLFVRASGGYREKKAAHT